MKRNTIIIRIVLIHSLTAIFIISIIQSLDFILISAFTDKVTFMDYVFYYFSLILPTVMPLFVIFESLMVLYLLPIQKAVNTINNGLEVAPGLMKKAKSRIFRLPLFAIILNFSGFLCGHFLYLPTRNGYTNFFSMFEIFYLIFSLASASVYAFIQITICNQVLAKPRKMLQIYYLDKQNSSKEISLKHRTILVSVLLIIYSLSHIIQAQTKIRDIETYYSNLLEKVIHKQITIAEAEKQYSAYLAPTIKKAYFPLNKINYEERRNRYNSYFLFAFCSFLFITFLTVFLFSKELVNQIKTQYNTLRRILLGEENLSKRMSIIQNDEVGYLTSAINLLMDKLNNILSKIAESSESVYTSSQNLDENIHVLSTASEEIFASINQINSNTQNQISVVSKTNDKLKTMLNSIQKISENVHIQTNFVEETSSAVQEMTNSIKYVNNSTGEANKLATRLVRVANEGGKAVGDTIEAIRNIQKASGEVKDIIELISSIASQTDLLSMNASIEAAQAGSAGKGFAVVADEIRKLAESSNEQASKIHFHIKNMYSRIIHGVKLSEEAEYAFKRIVDDIRMTTDLIREVSGAMEQQNVGTAQILSSISNLVASTQEVKEMTERLKNASEEIKITMEELELMSTEIKNSTNEQEIGNKEVLDKVNHLKDVSLMNSEIVNKLQSIVSEFASAEMDLNQVEMGAKRNYGVKVIT